MNNAETDKKIEETLNSFDAAKRAAPAPFLLTRINARLQNETSGSNWAQAFTFISRPLVVFSILAFLILNAVIITQKESETGNSIQLQNTAAAKYDFAINVSSMYDVENQ